MTEVAVKTKDVTPQVSGAPKAGDALAARLGATDLPQDGFAAARKDALSRLETMGLPGARDEYWRYTDPKPFNAPEAQPIAVEADGPDAPLFDDLDRLKLVFVDGVFDAAASDDPALDGVEISTLAQGAAWAQGLYGTLETAGQTPVARPFAALNTAVAADGLLIRVTGTPARPIHVIYRRKDDAADAVWHHVIRVEAGAEATLLETGIAGARSNGMIEADLAEGAKLHHIAARRAGHEATGLSPV